MIWLNQLVNRFFRRQQTAYRPNTERKHSAVMDRLLREPDLESSDSKPNETTIRWSQRTAYLFIESDENGAIVHTNLPDVTCPRCGAVVTDSEIDRQKFANHTCGARRGGR